MTLSRRVTILSSRLSAHQRIQSLDEGGHFAATRDPEEPGLASQPSADRISPSLPAAPVNRLMTLMRTQSGQSSPACEAHDLPVETSRRRRVSTRLTVSPLRCYSSSREESKDGSPEQGDRDAHEAMDDKGPRYLPLRDCR